MKINKCECGSENLKIEIELLQGADSYYQAHITCNKCRHAFNHAFNTTTSDALMGVLEYWNEKNPEKPEELEYITMDKYLDLHGETIEYAGKTTVVYYQDKNGKSHHLLGVFRQLADGWVEADVSGRQCVFPSLQMAIDTVKDSKRGEMGK